MTGGCGARFHPCAKHTGSGCAQFGQTMGPTLARQLLHSNQGEHTRRRGWLSGAPTPRRDNAVHVTPQLTDPGADAGAYCAAAAPGLVFCSASPQAAIRGLTLDIVL